MTSHGSCRLLVGLMIAALTSAGCRPGWQPEPIKANPTEPATVLFEGFAYRGEQVAARSREVSVSSQLPSKLAQEKGYVFWHRAPIDHVDFALKKFPARLDSIGYVILSAPKPNGEGFIYFDSGGPLFTIIAKKGSCEVTIRTMNIREGPWPWQNPDGTWSWQSPVWDPTNFILLIRRVPAEALKSDVDPGVATEPCP